jgi:hypothetical protein
LASCADGFVNRASSLHRHREKEPVVRKSALTAPRSRIISPGLAARFCPRKQPRKTMRSKSHFVLPLINASELCAQSGDMRALSRGGGMG